MYTILHYCLYGEGSIRSIKHHKTLKIIKQQTVFEVVPMRRTPSSSPHETKRVSNSEEVLGGLEVMLQESY